MPRSSLHVNTISTYSCDSCLDTCITCEVGAGCSICSMGGKHSYIQERGRIWKNVFSRVRVAPSSCFLFMCFLFMSCCHGCCGCASHAASAGLKPERAPQRYPLDVSKQPRARVDSTPLPPSAVHVISHVISSILRYSVAPPCFLVFV